MREYILTPHEREILKLSLAGEKLTRPQYTVLSQLKIRARRAFNTLKDDFKLLERLLS